VFIGVDGGGSKTALILIDAQGEIRATHVTSGAYYVTLGLDALGVLLATSVQALLAKARTDTRDIKFAFFGLPAYGEDRVATAEMDRLPGLCLPPGSYLCGNDMICGWAGSLVCRDGINVVAGTGSICYGERLGATARCGGWGEIFSDEGSAHWIACRGLDLFARMSDGRVAHGPLYHLMRERLQLGDDLDLCGHVYATLGGDRARVAQLCPLVLEAAASGDLAAAAILQRAADELALLVDTTRIRLGFAPGEKVDVSYSGGVFEGAGDRVLTHFAASLSARGTYRLCEPAFAPVIGAALYAAKRCGQPLSEAALERLRANRQGVSEMLRS
jgi:N-acetylglucosamine kinase-like BadF-type ATPase